LLVHFLFWHMLAANKDELVEMITVGAEKIINTNEDFTINNDIDAIIQRGEERTVELDNKYEGLNLDNLNNFKSDATVQQWEGKDFRSGLLQRHTARRTTQDG